MPEKTFRVVLAALGRVARCCCIGSGVACVGVDVEDEDGEAAAEDEDDEERFEAERDTGDGVALVVRRPGAQLHGRVGSV